MPRHSASSGADRVALLFAYIFFALLSMLTNIVYWYSIGSTIVLSSIIRPCGDCANNCLLLIKYSTIIELEADVVESDFKKRLRERRIEMGYDTQGKLAKALGMTTQTISYYESGERKPDYETFAKLARILNCSLNYLYGIDDLPDEEYEQIHKKTGLSYGAIEYLLYLKQLGGTTVIDKHGETYSSNDVRMVNAILEMEWKNWLGIIHTIEDYVNAANAPCVPMCILQNGEIVKENDLPDIFDDNPEVYFTAKRIQMSSNELNCTAIMDVLRRKLNILADVMKKGD